MNGGSSQGDAQKIGARKSDIRKNVESAKKESVDNMSSSYTSLIKLFRESADLDRGITWDTNSKNGFLIRDATNANGVAFSRHDYMQQIINLYRAAEEICDDCDDKSQSEHIKENIKKNATQLLDDCLKEESLAQEDEYINRLKEENSKIVDLLRTNITDLTDFSDIQIDKTLRLAEGYAGLNDDHYNIETHVAIGEKKFILRDTKICKLTEDQQKLFTNRENEEWYKSLSSIEKSLLEKHLSQITDEEHLIPTLLRKIPGARNAYKKELFEVKSDHEDILNTYFHSGSIATFSKDEDTIRQISESSFKQIQDAAGQNIAFITLSSENTLDKGNSGDAKVVRQTRDATGKNFINIPTNIFRSFNSNNLGKFVDQNQIFQTLSESNNKIEDNTVLKKYLLSNSDGIFGSKYKKAKKESKDDQKTLAIIELRHQINNQSGFLGYIRRIFERSGKNQHARMAGNFVSVLNLLPDDKKIPVLLSCKSGKDRTGYESYLADETSLIMTHPEINRNDAALKALSQSGHYQFLAGCNGGKPGCFGLIKVVVDGDKNVQSALFNKAADNSSSLFSTAERSVKKIIQSIYDTLFSKSANNNKNKEEQDLQRRSMKQQETSEIEHENASEVEVSETKYRDTLKSQRENEGAQNSRQ